MVIDEAPIRAKAVRDCESVLKQRKKARADWERFEKTDKPAFTQWLHQAFGKEMSRLHDLEATIEKDAALVRAVEITAAMEGLSYGAAYEWVLEERNRQMEEAKTEGEPSEESGTQDEDWEEFEEPFQKWDEGPFSGKSEEELKGFFQDAFGMSEEEAEAAYARTLGGRRQTVSEPSTRIKEVYRVLVRRLHPDRVDPADSGKEELWHAVQAAYQNRNLELLESLLARCDLEEGVVETQTSIWQLRRTWREIKNTVNGLRGQIREAKREMAWGFSRRTPKQEAEHRRVVGHEIKLNLHRYTKTQDMLRAQIGEWERRRKIRQERDERRSAIGRSPKSPGRSRRDSFTDHTFQEDFGF